MSKYGLDNILCILCYGLVVIYVGYRHGVLELSQFFTLFLAGLTVGITATKAVKDEDEDDDDDDDNEREDK